MDGDGWKKISIIRKNGVTTIPLVNERSFAIAFAKTKPPEPVPKPITSIVENLSLKIKPQEVLPFEIVHALVKATCKNNCENITAQLEYCQGATCTDFKPLDSNSEGMQLVYSNRNPTLLFTDNVPPTLPPVQPTNPPIVTLPVDSNELIDFDTNQPDLEPTDTNQIGENQDTNQADVSDGTPFIIFFSDSNDFDTNPDSNSLEDTHPQDNHLETGTGINENEFETTDSLPLDENETTEEIDTHVMTFRLLLTIFFKNRKSSKQSSRKNSESPTIR